MKINFVEHAWILQYDSFKQNIIMQELDTTKPIR